MSCTVTETLNGEWELTLVRDIDERGKWTRLSEGCILRAPVPAAMTPSVDLVTQQYQTSTYDLQIYKITTRSGPLHLRSGTGTNYRILGKYKKGREVIVLNKTTSSWYEVTAPDGKHGYMASQYLTFQRTETQTVQTNVGFRNQVIEARQLRDQPFRIYRVVPELDKVTVYARHIFYDLLDNMIKSLKPSPSAVGASVVQDLSGACLSAHDFTFYSDLTSTAEEVEWENINPVEALLGEGGLVEKYGAELARDWFDVFLVKRVGNDTDVSIRERKNLTGISYDVDETDVVTRIMPTGEDADGNVLYLPELYIDSPNIGAYTHPKWIHLPVSEAKEVTDGDEPKSKAQCYAEMRKAAQTEFDTGCDLPTVTLKVDFVNCSDAEEYKQYAALTDIFLGDRVRVVARRIGVEVSMRMTQYTYDCLTKKYTSVTLGTVADALEGSMISARQLASGSITGAKLALNSVGSGQLQTGSVGSLQIKNAAIGSAHIQDASISRAHIAEALIDVLNVNALTAVTAKIRELAAGSITADELYTSIAMIATAQITTANIINANIDWAQIERLSADIAEISKAQITTANINEANIDWAAITTLSAAVASMVKADIGTADIDWAHIKDLATDTAIITQGTAGELYIARLAVTEANMVSLTVGELVVKGADGHFYSVSVDESGNVVSSLKQVSNDDVADLSINGGEKIIEGSITAKTLNVQNIFGDNAVIRSLIAANLDVDTLFAREATVNALNAMDITSNTYLRLMVAGKGSCSWAMVSYAGYIICSGTAPAGSRNKGNNGQIFDTGVTVDYGTAIPVVTPDNTALLYATATKSYRGGWRSDTQDVIQGVYSDSGYKSSLNWNYGCMWFGNLRSMLSGTTIKSATLTLHRKTGSGAGSAKTLYLCAITNTSASGAPGIAANYGAIGTIGRNETATFAIPVAAVQGLASGTYGGLCLYESPYNFGSSTYSGCYMRMSGADTSQQPCLRVVYNDGGSTVG